MVLAIGTAVWIGTGLGGVLAGTLAGERLAAMLPGVTIGSEALGGAVTAMSVALVVVGAAHATLVVALRRPGRAPRSIATLLCGVLAVGFVVLGVAAVTAATTQTTASTVWIAGGAASFVVAGGYALATRRLVVELGAESAT